MRRLINFESHTQQSLHPCEPRNPLPADVNIDKPPSRCVATDPDQPPPDVLNQQDPKPKNIIELLAQVENINAKIGAAANCDPMMTGQIVPDPNDPNPSVIRTYPRGIRGTDMAMKDMFSDLIVMDDNGTQHPVPIIWGTQEEAVAAMIQGNYRHDETLVVDRVRLPMMSIIGSSPEVDRERYTYHYAWDLGRSIRSDYRPGYTLSEKYPQDTVLGLARGVPINIKYTVTAWTWFSEDMNQIVEQVILKTVPMAYIRIRGVKWEVVVELDSMENNFELEPAENQVGVKKYGFNLTAKTYIPQPIHRRKAVLKTRLDFVNSLSEQELSQVLERIEETVKEYP